MQVIRLEERHTREAGGPHSGPGFQSKGPGLGSVEHIRIDGHERIQRLE